MVGVYTLGPPILDLAMYIPVTGIYTLGVYTLGPPIWDLAPYIPVPGGLHSELHGLGTLA